MTSNSGCIQNGIAFHFTLAMETEVRAPPIELSAPPVLAFPDWQSVEDGSRPIQSCCDAWIDGFGAALEQAQPDGFVRPLVYISRATLDSE